MRQTRHQINQMQTFWRASQGCQIGIYALHASQAGQGVAALFNQLADALLGQHIHHDPGLFRANGQIHGTAYGGNRAGLTRAPVGQIAGCRHLESAQHTNIQMAATHHAKAVGMMEKRATGQQRHRLLARIDQIVIFLPGGRCRAHAQDTVLAVQYHFHTSGQMVGYQSWHANTQIHIGAVMDVLGDALRQFVFTAALIIERHAVPLHALSVHALNPPASVRLRGTTTTRRT
uniref:Uncharacterized protein n=1 Tax=Panagrolaimus superbus TaxID=310955 RepID=A0A914Y686_9BILA